MPSLLSTLLRGAGARVAEHAADAFAIDLISQKIREAEAGVENAKNALASLITRQRHEQRVLDQLQQRINRLEDRVREALVGGRDDLAEQGAEAIADLENEHGTRADTITQLNERIERLRHSVEKAHRRVADLRQSAIVAKAIDAERRSQRRLNRSLDGGGNAMHEAEQLIRRVTEQTDPLVEAEVVDEIDRSLSHEATEDTLSAAGFGPPSGATAQLVLARLRRSLPQALPSPNLNKEYARDHE